MKLFILLLLTIAEAYAVPVLNRNMAADGTVVTIWPDHLDSNHFYFAPNLMRIANDGRGTPKFHLTQYALGNCGRIGRRLGKCHEKAMLTSLLIADFEKEQLREAQAGIKKIRPQARFSAIPFLASKVEFDTSLKEFIDDHNCSPKAGQAADEVPCSMTLNSQGIYVLVPFLNAGSVLPFKFIYKIAGVIEGPDGKFQNQVLDYGLTVNLGGELLVKHPDLRLF
ncbi:MAG TPA: hypothetical protein VNJ01_13900 [Bacteriovoracaceae bacterium]|nr:hypothetical protein [Bacteriovoracaceae bacterium]